MSLSGAKAARARLRKLAEVKQLTRTHPRRVDFNINGSDFLCAMLFNIGMESDAIAELTGLTKGQVNYRTQFYERSIRTKAKQQKREFITARRMYRKGISPVSKMVISAITGRRSLVKKFVVGVLDERGLYDPPASGVLRNEK